MMHGSYDSRDHDNGITLCGYGIGVDHTSMILSYRPYLTNASEDAFFVSWFSHVDCPECIRAAEDRFDLALIIASRMRTLT